MKRYFKIIIVILIMALVVNVKAEAYLEDSDGWLVYRTNIDGDNDNYINKVNFASGYNLSFSINGTGTRFSWGTGEDSVLLTDEKVSYIKVNIASSSGVTCNVTNNKSNYYDFSNNIFTLKANTILSMDDMKGIGTINCSLPTTENHIQYSCGNYLNISLKYIDKDFVPEPPSEKSSSVSYKYCFGVINQNYINSLNNESSITSVSFDNIPYESSETTINDTDKGSITISIQQNNLASKNAVTVYHGTENTTGKTESYSGPKSFSLEYGLNAIYVKEMTEQNAFIERVTRDGDDYIDSKGFTQNLFFHNEISRAFIFNRLDNRSKVNTLKSLTITDVSINFNSDLKTYMATVPYKVSSVKINSSLTDANSSYVSGFGNRTVNLNEGMNDVLIKVKAENGDETVYTIKIEREKNDDASLRSIKVDDKELSIKEGVLKYSVRVDNEVVKPSIEIIPTDANAKYEIMEIEELKEGSNLFEITVTASNGTKLVYVLDIIRDGLISTNSKLKNIKIKNNDFKFDINKETFDVYITSDVEQIDLEIITDNNKAKYVVVGNKNLKNGSIIKIKVTAEDEETITNYTLNIIKESKKINILFIIIPTVIILLGGVIVLLRKKKNKTGDHKEKSVEDIKEESNNKLEENANQVEKEKSEVDESEEYTSIFPLKKSDDSSNTKDE